MDDLEVAHEWARRFCAFDLAAAGQLLAPGAVIHNIPANERIIGPEALIEAARPWSAAFDLTISLRELTPMKPGLFRALYDVSLKHVRPFDTPRGAVLPTGKEFEVQLEHRYTVAAGRITAVESYGDRTPILSALGLRAS